MQNDALMHREDLGLTLVAGTINLSHQSLTLRLAFYAAPELHSSNEKRSFPMNSSAKLKNSFSKLVLEYAEARILCSRSKLFLYYFAKLFSANGVFSDIVI